MLIEELDSWYDDEKETLFEKFLIEQEDEKKRPSADKRYLEAMKKLRENYEKKYVKIAKGAGKKNILDKIKEKFKKE